jgi:predicted dehydrogenase
VIGVGVIGYGYWGPNLVRNFSEAARARMVAVSDTRGERLRGVTSRFPGVKVTEDAQALIRDPAIDAVAIATPVATHFDLGLAALAAGKHVLVTKPLAASAAQAQRLVDEARRRNRVLMVDHTFVYSGAVRKMRELVREQQVGEVYYYDSVRVNLGLFQHDVNVLWDLAVHDLSIMDFVLGAPPRAVSAIGVSHVAGSPENVAYLTVFFDGSLIGHLHVNWLAPVKVRRTLIGGSRRMIVYDDLEPSEKVKVYDCGVTRHADPDTVYRIMYDYRTGDMWAPQISREESLQVEVAHFLDCIESGGEPLSGGEAGLRLVRILEAANHSMRRAGARVEL